MATNRQSAGLLMFRKRGEGVEVFVVHPGGPFFANKHDGAWSIPKGVIKDGEEPLTVAIREFQEETGRSVESCAGGGDLIPLGTVRQKGGKLVHGWAFEGDWSDGEPVRSNMFEMEWPPRSGRRQRFPEVDQGEFVPLEEVERRINEAQSTFIERLLSHLKRGQQS